MATNVEEILIRVGADGKALMSGLQRIGAGVKSWASNIIEDFTKHTVGRLVGLAMLERQFSALKDRILEIARAKRELGTGASFIQGVFGEASAQGVEAGSMIAPLKKLNELLGKAKFGDPQALSTFTQWGIITQANELKGKKLTDALGDLAAAYAGISDPAARAAFAQDFFGKQADKLIPILEGGREKVEELSRFSFFKLSEETIGFWTQFWAAMKTIAVGAGAVILNVVTDIARGLFFVAAAIDAAMAVVLGQGRFMDVLERNVDAVNGKLQQQLEIKQQANALDQQNLEFQYSKSKILREQNQLLAQMADREKLTVGELADRARKIMGLDKMPRGLESVRMLTPAMAGALRIQNLEDQVKVATAHGQSGLAHRLQTEADRLRSINPALRSSERDPMMQMNNKLSDINANLETRGIVVKEIKGQD